MAGIQIEITIQDDRVRELLGTLVDRMQHLEPALKEIGEIVVESVQRNFEEHQSPEGKPWKPLTKRYREWKTNRKGRSADDILLLNRILMGSIHPEVQSDKVIVGTNIVYAAIHQFGGPTGRKRSVTMPARPFLGVRNEDWTEIRAVLERHLTGN